MRIHDALFARPTLLLAVVGFFLGGTATAPAQRNAMEPKPPPMKRAPADTNSVHWHTIVVAPKPGLPEIHFYDKFNPVWWFKNADEPSPPDWYRPGEKHRETKWWFRNPFHNFDHYVIGVADKEFHRSGRYPERNSDPDGGWDFAVARRRIVLLPYVSYERSWCNFYLGWREQGAFGIKLNFHRQTRPAADESSPPKPGH